MQPHERNAPPFEVFCNHCHTSFAAGTKRCVHCGERLSRTRMPMMRVRPGDGPIETGPAIDPTMVLEEEEPRRGLSPFTLVWIVILLGGYLVRACTDGG